MANEKKVKVTPQMYARMKREQASGPTWRQKQIIEEMGRAYERKMHWWLYLPKPDPVDREWDKEEPQEELSEEMKQHFAELASEFKTERYKMTFDSDIIKEVEYTIPLNLLEVVFSSGKVYSYHGIRPHIWKQFAESERPVRFFKANICGRYTCCREMTREKELKNKVA